MSNTTNNNFIKLPTGPVDWVAAFNDFMDKVEAGRTILLTAGETLAVRDCFYIKAADGKAWKATTTTPCHGVWQSTSTAAAATGYGQIGGTMTYASWTWTPGDKLYSTAAGALTTTATNYQVGYAISATQICLTPFTIDTKDIIKGDGTAGRVLKSLKLTIEDGTNADTIKCTTASMFNGDAIGATDNVAKNATTGSFTLNAAGTALTIELADVVGLLSCAIIYNDSALSFVPLPAVTGNDLVITAYALDVGVDLTTIAAGKSIQVLIGYITSG